MTRHFAFIGVFLAFLGVSGTALSAVDPERSNTYLSKAHYYMDRSDWDSALIELRNAIQQDPGNARAYFESGQVNVRIGDVESAERNFREALARNYNPPETQASLAELLVKREKLGVLLDEIQPDDRPPIFEARVRSARGYAYLGLQRTQEAERSFQEAIDLSDHGALALAGLAQVDAILGKNAEAASLLERATAEDPTLGDAWLLLGYVRLWQGDRAGARVPFDKAVEQAPSSEPARRARALFLVSEDQKTALADIHALLQQNAHHPMANFLDAAIKAEHGQMHDAEVALQKISNIDDYAPALYLLARVNFALGELGQTDVSLNRLLILTPDAPDALTLRAALLMRRGNSDLAIPVLKHVLEIHSDDRAALTMLADAYATTGQRREADATVQQLAKLPAADATAAAQLALQQTRLGHFSDAVATLEASRAVGPLSMNSTSLLITNYVGQKDYEGAWKAAEAYRDTTHGSAESQVMLGVVALRRDGPEAARPYFEKAVALDPDLAAAAVDLAGVYRVEKKPDDARAVLDRAVRENPNNLDLIMARAELERAEHATAAEIQWLERAREAAPAAPAPRFALAKLYLANNDVAKAIAVATELTKIDESEPKAIAILGHAQLANKEFQNAITSFQKLAAVTQDSAGAQFQLVRAYLAASDLENANLTLRKAVDQHPDDLPLQNIAVDFAVSTKQIDSYLAFARDLSVLHPDDPRLFEFVGTLLVEQHHASDAVQAFSTAVSKGGDARAVLGLAQAQASSGGVESGIDILRDWLRRNPSDRQVRIGLARLLGSAGHNDEAIAEHEKLLADQPNDPLLLNDLAWLYLTVGDKRALPTAQEAHRLAPDLAMVDDTLGWVLVQQGDVEGGLKFLEQATNPPSVASPGMKYRLAVAFDRLGRQPEARKALDEALASGTSFAEAKDAEALRAKLGN
ncbi:MAG: XrtA/PEP-CTERM system TPR-repeat protein PrsT [Alphaproteobacteria bacterium]